MSFAKRFFRGAGFLGLQGVAQKLLGLAASMVLARGLNASDFGTYSALMNTANSGAGFAKLGLDAALHVKMAEKEEEGKGDLVSAGLAMMVLAGFAGGMTLFFLSEWLATHIYGIPSLAIWLKTAAILVVSQCLFQFCYAVLVGLHEYARYAIVMVLSALTNLVAISFGISLGGLVGGVVATIVVSIFTALSLARLVSYTLKKKSIVLRLKDLSENAKKLAKIGMPFYAAGLISIPATLYMQGLLAKTGGVEDIGILRIVMSINSIILFMPTSISAVTVSMLSEANSDREIARKQFIEYALLNLKIVWFFCLIVALTFWIIMPALVNLLFGKQYDSAVSVARLGLFVAVALAIVNAASHTYFAQMKVGVIFVQTATYSAMLVIFGTFLIPQWQTFGYVLSELIGYSLVCIVAVGTIVKEGIREGSLVSGHLWLMLLTVILCPFLTSVDKIASGLHAALVGFAAISLTLIVCYRLALSNQEKMELVSIVRKRTGFLQI